MAGPVNGRYGPTWLFRLFSGPRAATNASCAFRQFGRALESEDKSSSVNQRRLRGSPCYHGTPMSGWCRGWAWRIGGTDTSTANLPAIRACRPAWNKGRVVGQKRPLMPKHVWAIRVRLEIAENHRELALFNLAIDSKLRGCDLVKLKVADVYAAGQVKERASIVQSKTLRPVRFEITEGTRRSLARWMEEPLMVGSEYLWPGRFHERLHISTRLPAAAQLISRSCGATSAMVTAGGVLMWFALRAGRTLRGSMPCFTASPKLSVEVAEISITVATEMLASSAGGALGDQPPLSEEFGLRSRRELGGGGSKKGPPVTWEAPS